MISHEWMIQEQSSDSAESVLSLTDDQLAAEKKDNGLSHTLRALGCDSSGKILPTQWHNCTGELMTALGNDVDSLSRYSMLVCKCHKCFNPLIRRGEKNTNIKLNGKYLLAVIRSFNFSVFELMCEVAIHPVIHAFILLRHSVQQKRKGIVSLKKSAPNKMTWYISIFQVPMLISEV